MSHELRSINEKTAESKECNTQGWKGFFYCLFTSVSASTAAFSSFLLPSFLLFPSTLASLDVLKGHVKYSEGIFITVLSGNACGLISLSVRGRRAKWIAKREIKCIRLPVCFFLPFFNFREKITLFLLNLCRKRTQILGFIQRYN